MKVHTTLFGGAGNALENRTNAITFLVLLYLLFYSEVKESSRDLVNILCGAYVAVLAKSTDYWFREKKDHEHEEEMEASKGRYKLNKGK